MPVVDAAAVQQYLDQNFLTLAALAERAGLTPERVLEMIEAECAPGHSYEVRGELTVTSSFGDYRLPVPPQRYYHPSIAEWLTRAETLAEDRSLAAVSKLVRADFEAGIAKALQGKVTPGCKSPEHAWQYLLDGTWGLCLKDISVAAMARKELARAAIAEFSDPGPEESLSETARSDLNAAIKQYNSVAADFAPHEVAESSRRLEVEAAARKYGLGAEA